VGLNIILALTLGVCVILYFNQAKQFTHDQEKKQQEHKLSTIKPPPKTFAGRDDIIDLVFSIQDFYPYNPEAYEEMIDNIDAFFKIYDIIKTDPAYCEYYYTIADTKKSNAVNALQSMIFNIPNSKIPEDKLIRAYKRLETLLVNYINELYKICDNDLTTKGFDVTRKLINTGPKEYNNYKEKDFTYQFI
jgi:effector-binding domain-containing protein